jgi:hypothetical protein
MEYIIQITGLQVVIILIGIGVLQFLLANWIKSRIEQSIRHEYDKKLEDYKFSQLQRQKAESIANLFAFWIKYRGNENTLLSKKDQFEYYENLNRMSIELALWIKDVSLLNDIMTRLQNNPEAKSVHQLVGEVRKLILNDAEDTFDSNQVVLWPTKELLNKLLDDGSHETRRN